MLIPFTSAHFATVMGWFTSERELVQWGGPALTHPLTASQLQAMLDERSNGLPARLCWMAEREGSLVGHAQLALDRRNGNMLLARVGVAPEARGRGLAIPMLRAVLAEGFAIAEMERAELNVYTWNTAAIRTYEKLGFVAEGVRRSAARVGAERWDTAMMGLLRKEWLALA